MEVKNNKVLLGMSGGVDSSAAALILKEQGYEVIGATFRLYEEPGGGESRAPGSGKAEPSGADEGQSREFGAGADAPGNVRDAASVCETLGIEHIVADLRDEFRHSVIDDFAASYVRGETPNPCVTCNRTIKFPMSLALADRAGAAYIATGHYAGVVFDEGSGRFLLTRAEDRSKDQSYFLYNMTQEQLGRVRFPLASLSKHEIREIAKKAGIKTAENKESQDICFVPDGDYGAFLCSQCGVKEEPGDYIFEGKAVGKHRGIPFYTTGQRKGLGIALGRPAFVVSKDVETNRIYLGDNEELFSTRVFVKDINYIPFERPEGDMKVKAKLRYAHREADALLHPLSENTAVLEFKEPQRAVTAGQSAVFYDEDSVIGGGIISTMTPEDKI